MNMKKLHDLIRGHEGLRLKPYRCPAGRWTIGYGRNLTDKGISKDEAQFMFNGDLADCAADLEAIFPGQFQIIPMNIQMVLMDMRFQLGHGGFRKFKKMIRAVRMNDLKEMVRQMKDSRWYRQVPERAEDLIRMVEVFV